MMEGLLRLKRGEREREKGGRFTSTEEVANSVAEISPNSTRSLSLGFFASFKLNDSERIFTL